MFATRDLEPALASVRESHAPGALVLDVERDFESLDPAVAEELGVLVDSLAPASFPAAWLLDDAPEQLVRFASDAFVIGMPGDGGVAWTRQTEPPVVLVKPRLQGSPPDFVRFLVAEALVEIGTDVPEHFLAFFQDQYRELDAAVPFDPAGTYQLAAALFDAWIGRQTRETFAAWTDDNPSLHDAWRDAGERLEPRLGDLSGELARGETAFPAAAELACSAIKHDVAVPAPFGALDTTAYVRHGPDYAVEWARKTVDQLTD